MTESYHYLMNPKKAIIRHHTLLLNFTIELSVMFTSSRRNYIFCFFYAFLLTNHAYFRNSTIHSCVGYQFQAMINQDHHFF